jgi:uncharacterized membrane protein
VGFISLFPARGLLAACIKHTGRIAASLLQGYYKRVAIPLRLMSGNSRGVSYAMSFLLFAFLAVLVVVLMVVAYLLGRRWL